MVPPNAPRDQNDVPALLGTSSVDGTAVVIYADPTTHRLLVDFGGAGSGTVTTVNTGTGLTGGPITTTGTISIANTTVTAGSYTNANITVNAQGQITAASNGSSGLVTQIIAGTDISISPSGGTGIVTVNVDVAALATDSTFITDLIANTTFTTDLANDSNFYTTLANNTSFITDLTSNTTFISDIVNIVNNAGSSIQIDLTTQVTGILPLANGGTQTALIDPMADTLFGWDSTDNSAAFFNLGSGLSYDHSTHTLSSTGQINIDVFGDGSDGSAIFDGTSTILGLVPVASVYTLTRDIYLSGGTINSGVTIETAGYQIFDNVLLTNNGTIQNNGFDGSGLIGGIASLGVTVLSGSAGGNGGAGGVGAGGSGAAGSPSADQTNSIGTQGGQGISGLAGTITPSATGVRNYQAAASYRNLVGLFTLGSGGGGGGGAVSETGTGGTHGGNGGSGGGAGGMIALFTKLITGSGSLVAKGGNGGDGATAVGQSPGNGGSASGGGAGGVIMVVTQSPTLSNTTDVSGGLAGNAAPGTGGGTPGGGPGFDGSDGIVYLLNS